MTVTLLKVVSEIDIGSVAKLAQQIWRDYFTSIIGSNQVEYMLEKFQSIEAISSQMESGWEYYIVAKDNEFVGYTGLVPDTFNRKMMISKIYVKSNARGHGIGGQILTFVESECIKRAYDKIWLTVNRFNHDAVNWYSRNGFDIVDEVKKDIGNGFFMDDYIFEKKLVNKAQQV